MVSEEKVRMMTQAAMIQKREERRSIEICRYRKKDYVSLQMIKIWVCYTVAYLLLTLAGAICIGGSMQSASVSDDTLLVLICVWVVGYLGFLLAALVMARHCYSKRYRMAASLVRTYRQQLMALEDYYTERSLSNDSSAGASAKNK